MLLVVSGAGLWARFQHRLHLHPPHRARVCAGLAGCLLRLAYCMGPTPICQRAAPRRPGTHHPQEFAAHVQDQGRRARRAARAKASGGCAASRSLRLRAHFLCHQDGSRDAPPAVHGPHNVSVRAEHRGTNRYAKPGGRGPLPQPLRPGRPRALAAATSPWFPPRDHVVIWCSTLHSPPTAPHFLRLRVQIRWHGGQAPPASRGHDVGG